LCRATPAPGTIVLAPETLATTPVIAAQAPEIVVQATNLTPGMAPQPPSAGTIDALGPVFKSVTNLAPTAIRKTRAADVRGGTRLHYNHHRLQQPRLQVPGAMSVFPYASPPKHQSSLGEGW
jgi:hypothetical protein